MMWHVVWCFAVEAMDYNVIESSIKECSYEPYPGSEGNR